MNHHTVTTTFGASRGEVFHYLADIEKLPEWATEFARELNSRTALAGLSRSGARI